MKMLNRGFDNVEGMKDAKRMRIRYFEAVCGGK
jgi:hypothetical protein